ncbi:hypothetical protein ACFDTO_34295 [Microbacteriaceae bacterium 4G12]
MREKVIVSFSGGKDSVYMLHKLMQDETYEIVSLLTTTTTENEVSGHMIDYKFIELQAASIGIPAYKIQYSLYDQNGFEQGLIEAMEHFRTKGVTTIAFGDCFLEDCIAYKKKLVASQGYEIIFPLAEIETEILVKNCMHEGYKAKVVSIRLDKLDSSFIGREWDEDFLEDLPTDIDLSGEFGEYHTFVYDGEIFSIPIQIELEKDINFIPRNPFFSEVGYLKAVEK